MSDQPSREGRNLNALLDVAKALGAEMQLDNLLPVIISKKGVEKIVEVELDKSEKENFDISIKSVKELLNLAVKIDPSLSK